MFWNWMRSLCLMKTAKIKSLSRVCLLTVNFRNTRFANGALESSRARGCEVESLVAPLALPAVHMRSKGLHCSGCNYNVPKNKKAYFSLTLVFYHFTHHNPHPNVQPGIRVAACWNLDTRTGPRHMHHAAPHARATPIAIRSTSRGKITRYARRLT